MVDNAFVALLRARALGQDSVVHGVSILLEEEVFDTFMKDSKLSASYFAIMLRSLVTRQVGTLHVPCCVCCICSLRIDN